MTTRIAKPDPERSIIYLKEKLECAAESFGGSAAYNMKQALRLQFVIAILSAIVAVAALINIFILSSYTATTLHILIGVLSTLIIILALFNNSRNYSLCWLAHARATLRMKEIEAKIAFIEHRRGRVSETDCEEFYDEYRSVYNDTNMTLQLKRKMPSIVDKMHRSSILKIRRWAPLVPRSAGWESHG